MNSSSKLLKKLDIFLLILFPLVSISLSLFFKANFLTSIFLFYGLPSLWLSIRTPAQIKKTLIFSAIFSIPLGILIDYIGIIDGSWFVPFTVFSFRLLNIVPIEDLIWGFFVIYSIIIFYEHFLDKGKHELIDKKMKYLIWPIFSSLLIFLTILFTKPELLNIKHVYLWVGILLILLPSITFLSFFPRLLSKYVKTGSYFFLLALIFEITGLQLNQWAFPGTNFIGWIDFFGFRFPFEEFFFFVVMSSTCVLSFYEFFDDDRK